MLKIKMRHIADRSLLFASGLMLLLLPAATAGGAWTALSHAPTAPVNSCMLLSDGTVWTHDVNGNCQKLTPDSHGSYVNGTWTWLKPMNFSRLDMSSQLLQNGNLFVCGAEYGSGYNNGEVYDTLNNSWTILPNPNVVFVDSMSAMLPNGNVLVNTVGDEPGNLIYNVAANAWQHAADALGNQDETCWITLANSNILTIDTWTQNAEHYVPSLNQWVRDASVPVPLYNFVAELGPGFLLPNGSVFFLGGTANTAIYTPGSPPASAGSWVAGPQMVFGGVGYGAPDAPAAMMANGKILCALGPTNNGSGFVSPTSFYEYDYTANSFTSIGAPGGGASLGGATYVYSMLNLPDGSVLFVNGQNTTSLYIYTPDGSPLAAGQPTINSISQNPDGTYLLTGTGLNGISVGAVYGDDEQMNSNYPLVRMTNNLTGLVYYARTFNWSSTGVMTGSQVLTTEFSLPPNLPAGNYSLVVVANGNPSAPTTFIFSPPTTPFGLIASNGGNGLVNLSWNASAGASAYNVRRASSSGGYFATIATVSATNYIDAPLTNGLTYYYQVAAIGSSGVSATSATVSAAPTGPPPTPVGLVATSGQDGVVSLVWNLSYGATAYNVKRATSGGGPYVTIATLNGGSYTDSGLVNGQTYYYVVSALGSNGESVDSAPANATPAAPIVAAWFKADAITGLANGAKVSGWIDSSGHGRTATQSNSSRQPTYLVNSMNGLPVVSFNAVNSATMTFLRPVQDDFTIFCVFRSPQGSGSGNLYYQGAGLVNGEVSGVANDFGACLFANGAVCAGTGNPDVAANSAAGYNDGNAHLMTFRRTRNSGKVDLYVDGAWVGSTTGGTQSLTAPAYLALAAQQTGLNFLTADFGEIKIYSSAFSDVDRTAQECSLMNKWGVAVPVAPTGVQAQAADNFVQLSWNSYPGATNYYIQRATASGGPYTTIGASGIGPNYVDATVNNGTTYYYAIEAVGVSGITPNSAVVNATPAAPSLAAWFNADAITGLANGASVATWTDSSGNGFNATQSISGKRPSYVTGSLNGLPVVHFNSAGNNDLNFPRPVQDDFTILCVFRTTQGLGLGNLYYQGAGLVNGEVSGSVADFGSCLFTNGLVCAGTGNPDVAVTSLRNNYNDGNPHLMTFKRGESSGLVTLYMDGNYCGTNYGSTSSLTAPSQLTLGAQQPGYSFLNGDIAEVKIFSTALSDFERTNEENYLMAKWGMQASPTILATPAGLTGITGNRQIALSWLGVSDATAYTLVSSTNPYGPFTAITTTATTSFVDTNAVSGMTNYYEVTATAVGGASATSAPVGVYLPLPMLAVRLNPPDSLIVSWPVWASDWNLYSASNLTPPVAWTLVGKLAVSTNNNQLNITLPLTNAAAFFQLRSP